jgi:hypothetical protein
MNRHSMTESPESASSVPASSSHNSLPPLSLRKRFLFLAVLVFFSLVFALLLAEMSLRLVAPQPLAAPLYRETDFGYSLLPDLRHEPTESDAGIPYRITTNRLGFRGREVPVPKSPGTRRVLVLGDSFPFGVGVSDTDCFPVQTENLLNALPTTETQRTASSPVWEVVNLGCPGWGTENELAFWQQKGRDLEADLLVVAFYKNDFSDNMRHSLFQVQDAQVVASPRPVPSLLKRMARAVPFYRFLCGHSHLVNFVRRALVVRAEASHSVPSPPRAGVESSAETSVADKGAQQRAIWQEKQQVWADQLAREKAVYRALMESLLQDAKSRKIPVLILLLAGTEDLLYPWPSDQLKEATFLAREWTGAGLADSVDTLELFRSGEAAGKPIFLPKDGHFTLEGNRLVAERLAARIREMGLASSRPSSSLQEGAP